MIKLKKVQRLVGSICACVLLFHAVVQPAYAAEIEGVKSPVYVVIDAYSGEILYSKNENKSIYPASTAKLVTAMVVLDVADKNKTITITNNMLGTFSSDVATIGLQAGGTYTVYELLELLLISSAADAAEALAVGCFGSTEKCLEKMNEKAASLGLTKTHFDNTVGLDIGNNYKKTYTTAAEFAVLSRLAMTYPEIREIVKTLEYTLPARTNNRAITRKTTNLFLRGTYTYAKDLYTIIGTKTGITQAAGRTMVVTANDGQHEVIYLTFLNPDTEVMYESAQKALNYTFTQNKQNKIDLAEERINIESTSPGSSTSPGGIASSGSNTSPGEIASPGSSTSPGGITSPGNTAKPGSNSGIGSSTTEKSDIGWKQAADGSWNYYLADGKKKTGWLINDSYEWYYFSALGTMQTGWIKSNEKWYYLDKTSGKMVVSTTTPDGYAVGPDGAWIE